jgi:hypothetical protein
MGQRSHAPELTKVPLVRAGFERLLHMLVGPPAPSPVDLAYANWREAYSEYEAAKQAEDTRRIGTAWKALRKAKAACLAAEVGARR